MRFANCLLVLAMSLSSPLVAWGGTIPTFKVGGSTSATGFTVDSTSAWPMVTISFDPATLTVGNLFDVGNSGLSIGDTLSFTGGSITFDYPSWSADMGQQDLPFVYPGMVSFTTPAGGFTFDSAQLNILPNAIPGLSISDAEIVAFSRGTINGPDGSAPADFMLFVNMSDGLPPFGNVAWALYSPEVIPYPVPEPTSAMIAISLFGVGAVRTWRKRRRLEVAGI